MGCRDGRLPTRALIASNAVLCSPVQPSSTCAPFRLPHCCRSGPLLDSLHFVGIHLDAFARDLVAEEEALGSEQFRLLWGHVQIGSSQRVQDQSYSSFVFLQCVGENCDVIEVHKAHVPDKVAERLVDSALMRCRPHGVITAVFGMSSSAILVWKKEFVMSIFPQNRAFEQIDRISSGSGNGVRSQTVPSLSTR
ncbi:BQ5605_C006g03818 [Microbotryum silenes-dioicae]|uniref:BQ5605_C006g03818 protein n=1 Tax=Microbotryum silenes-dioicae TaxID=796604 RepID=A0A2X0MSD7_9BASI|nr:BQ5605_C006g03818 [Microbotryum silenes-dioicae]